MKYFITTIFVLGITMLSIAQNSYYVSNAGNDTSDGSLATPWKTIQHGFWEMQGGDTLNIMGGTYPEKLYFEVSGTSNNWSVVRAYQNQNVIIDGSSFTGDPNDGDSALFYAGTVSYFRVEGIHFTNNYSTSGSGGFAIQGNGDYIDLINCKFSNIAISSDPNYPVTNETNHPVINIWADSPTDSMTHILVHGNEIYDCRPGYSECLSIGGNVTDFVFTNNHIHHNTNIAIDAGGNYFTSPTASLDHARRGLIKNNHCHHNPSAYSTSAGIYVDGGWDIIIENNNLHHNDYGIEIGCEEAGTTKNVIARNNLIYFNKSSGISLGGYDVTTGGTVLNSKVLNNTFYHNDTKEEWNGEVLFTQFENGEVSNNIFYISGNNHHLTSNALNQPNLVMNYNLVYSDHGEADIQALWDGVELQGLNNIYTAINIGSNDTYGNPLFADIANYDFHIASNSPAIDVGDPSFTPSPTEVDIDNQNRVYNNIVDPGADEYQTSLAVNYNSKFDAVIHNSYVVLKWTTNYEQNNDYFIIQRSTNSKNWENWKTVNANNKNEVNKYIIYDNNPIDGDSYYRLVQLDIDGTKEYSSIIHVSWQSNKKQIKVLPNPVKSSFKIDNIGFIYQSMIIYNSSGTIVYKNNIKNSEQNQIDISNLIDGLYILQLTSENGEIQSTLFTIIK